MTVVPSDQSYPIAMPPISDVVQPAIVVSEDEPAKVGFGMSRQRRYETSAGGLDRRPGMGRDRSPDQHRAQPWRIGAEGQLVDGPRHRRLLIASFDALRGQMLHGCEAAPVGHR